MNQAQDFAGLLILPDTLSQPEIQDEKLLQTIAQYKKIIIFSPHLDDAILSMGSLIYELAQTKKEILVVNVFTKGSSLVSDLTQKLLTQAKQADAQSYFIKRKQEDAEAFASIPLIQKIYLDFVDSPWRTKEDLTPLYPITTIGVPSSPNDRELRDEISAKIQTLGINTAKTLIFAPLGRGNHIDHLLIRSIITEVFTSVIYCADFPYSTLYEDEHDFIKQMNLTPISWHGTYSKKKAMILQYTSQFTSFFKNGTLQLPFETYYIK